MQVVFSPCLPQETCLYVVRQSGLRGIDHASIQLHTQHMDTGQAVNQAESRVAAVGPLQQLHMQADSVASSHQHQPVGKVPRIMQTDSKNSLKAGKPMCAANDTSSASLHNQPDGKLATGVFAPT